MLVKIGKVKTVREILGLKPEDPNITGFVVLKDRHHYTFNEGMNAWGITKHVCVFIERTSKDHPHYDLIGTLAGDTGFSFMSEWLEGTFDQELPDEDPRAMFLARALKGNTMGPEEFFKKLLGGE